MKLFEGKTKSERNKTIAAIVLGAACVVVLFFAFGRGMFTGSTTTAAKPTPTPKKSTSSSKANSDKLEMPSARDQLLHDTTQLIAYEPARFGAPDAGRNIFAFYEPPKPTPYVATPVPIPSYPPPTPAPTPPIQIASINPQSVYAGSDGFRMDIAGDRFTPETRIYFDQQEVPARFINETRMTADIPRAFLQGERRPTILAQTADGTLISNPIQFDIQPPPKPTFQYIGMIARKRSNNDTAYFQEPGKPLPTGARLNDVVAGRFRVISISAQESVLEDVNLGFKHKLALFSPPPTATLSQPSMPGGGRPPRSMPGGRQVYTPMPPANSMYPGATNSRIPGIPDNIPRYVQPQPGANSNVDPKDDDEDGID
ncbi:MAG: IPT/TIG domain-containing protein [Pyrinomonadaceae bacterium]